MWEEKKKRKIQLKYCFISSKRILLRRSQATSLDSENFFFFFLFIFTFHSRCLYFSVYFFFIIKIQLNLNFVPIFHSMLFFLCVFFGGLLFRFVSFFFVHFLCNSKNKTLCASDRCLLIVLLDWFSCEQNRRSSCRM